MNALPHLTLTFLGSFSAQLDGAPVTGFRSVKARALLAYVAIEQDRPHLRSTLAGLLWPDQPQAAALTNLRHVLANLHSVLADRSAAIPFLQSKGDPISFNPTSACTCDAVILAATLTRLSQPNRPQLTEMEAQNLHDALTLYRGPLLEGFALTDSDRFEEWLLQRREQLHQLALLGCERLTEHYRAQGAALLALPFAERAVELEPTAEAGQRRLIQLLIHLGRRGAALTQLERCRALLADELGVSLAPETLALYQQLQAGTDDHSPAQPLPVLDREQRTHAPPFLAASHARIVEPPPLLACHKEIVLLQERLAQACAGSGGLLWITGEAGQGKTVLAHGFAHQAQSRDPKLIVVTGNCNAHSGLGDPYLPFRQILGLLAGDVEPLWRAGAITRSHATRLWHLLPHTLQALVTYGPDLLETRLM